jgi:hypothetical protein
MSAKSLIGVLGCAVLAGILWCPVSETEGTAAILAKPGKGHTQVMFAASDEGLKWMPDVVPAKMRIEEAGADTTKGVLQFINQMVVSAQDVSFRPSGKTESRELRFAVSKAELPVKLPAALGKVTLEADGNYLVLPAHSIYSLYGFASKRADREVANAFESVLGKIKTKGLAVYAWSDKKLEFIVYDDPVAAKSEYRGTVTLTENVPEVRDRLNAILLAYYWATLAKFSASQSEKDHLKLLASSLAPKDAVEQYVEAK